MNLGDTVMSSVSTYAEFKKAAITVAPPSTINDLNPIEESVFNIAPKESRPSNRFQVIVTDANYLVPFSSGTVLTMAPLFSRIKRRSSCCESSVTSDGLVKITGCRPVPAFQLLSSFEFVRKRNSLSRIMG